MNEKGFTLIELIVIISVLTILVVIGVPRYLGHTQEAKLIKLKHDAKLIQDASDRYYMNNNDWPFLLNKDGEKIIVTDPNRLEIIYKVQNYDESKLGIDPEEDIVLYEIDFNKLKPYIRRLDSNIAYFVAAVGNPDFGITVLDPESETTQERINNSPKANKIVIKTAEDLAKIGNDSNYPLNGNYIQMANIDLSSYSNWIPIGNYSEDESEFTGTFDGNGFVITNLTINKPDISCQGLFGRTNGATLTNIALENVNVKGKNHIGGLVGWSRASVIKNSCVTGDVEGWGNIGGLVGYNHNSTIEKSHSTGNVSGGNDTGGLVGYSYNGTITNSYSTGRVLGKNFTGGLVGYSGIDTITNSYSTGTVTGAGNYAGGLVGRNWRGTIANSYATGNVSGENKIGGLVGKNCSGTITNTYSIGDVSGISSAGGLVGLTYNDSGLISRIENSYALESSLSLIGARDYTSSGSADKNIVTNSKKLSRSQMKQKSYYSNNWNFDNTWQIDEDKSYPYLRTNPQFPPPQ